MSLTGIKIDWNNPKSPISKHFTVKDAIWLPKWKRLATEEDGLDERIKDELEFFFGEDVEKVRRLLDLPMKVHCCYRPKAYNELVGGAVDSAHMVLGSWAALDFEPITGLWPITESCDSVRTILAPKLRMLCLRMEYNPGSAWVHIDNAPVKSARYFSP